MSAIAGCILPEEACSSSPALIEGVEVLLAALKHRGKESSNTWQGPGCALGAATFATTPEDQGENQPLADHASGRVLVFDGRLDNREELLGVLARSSERPTDAELVLRAYNLWGENCARKLLGDFAFAIWDSRSRTLYAARDPLGLRPFFYRADGTRFDFASEVQALIRLPGVSTDLDEFTLSEYLMWWTDFPQLERTFFRSVRRLLPAHWLRVTPTGVVSQRYWEIDPERRIRHARREDYLEQFGFLFEQAVTCRLRSHKRMGVFLSGGMDSAAVATVASRHTQSREPLQAFCLQLLDHRDESGLAELVARRAGMKFRRIPYFADSFLEGLEAHIERLAMPFVEEGWVHDRNLFTRAAENGCNVILTGDGGDELFNFAWGYVADLIQNFRLRAIFKDLELFSRFYGYSRWTMLKGAVPYLVPQSGRSVWKLLRWRKAPPWVNPGFAERTELLRRLRQIHPHLPFDSLSAAFDHYLLTRGRRVLVNERRELAAAHHGLELRFPFHDRRLLEFMLAIPWEEKVTNGRVKPFLREVPGLLPEELRRLEQKADYGGVNESLMRKGDLTTLRAFFQAPPAAASEYVNLDKAREACVAYLEGNDTQQRPTWVFACLFLWLEKFSSPARTVPAGGPLRKAVSA